MNLSHLYYFKKLAETQHYTKAAKELFITQPSLSGAISSLERELSVPLFKKKGRNVELTKHGSDFLSYVNESLSILETGIAAIKEQTGLLNGTLEIGCIPTLLGQFLPNLQNHYLQKNPNITFNIHHGMSLEIVHAVSTGTYDIGFCSKVDNKPELDYVPISYQEIIAIVSNSHPLAEKDAICLIDLKPDKLITYRKNIPIGKLMHQLLSSNDMTADYSYDDEISIAGAVSNSSKIALVADTSFLKQFDTIKKIHLTDVPLDFRLIYMVFNNEAFLTPILKDFTNFVMKHEINLP